MITIERLESLIQETDKWVITEEDGGFSILFFYAQGTLPITYKLHSIFIKFPIGYPIYPPKVYIKDVQSIKKLGDIVDKDNRLYIDMLYEKWTPLITPQILIDYLYGLLENC